MPEAERRPRTRRAPEPTPTLPAAELAVLVELADLRAAATPDDVPSLFRVRLVGAEVELGWLRLRADQHPLDELVGRTAPDDWHAIGVVAGGRAHHLDRADPPVRVVSTHLVTRAGTWASRCRAVGPPDELGPAFDAAGGADDPGRVVGRVDDACRRALVLPTTAPEVGTGHLWAVRWLDAVVAGAAGRPDAASTWADVARLHPAVAAVLPDAADGRVVPGPEQLGDAARHLAAWRGWGDVRRACADGTATTESVGAALAAWLDDGAFSRWALGAYPDLDDLVDAAAALLDPAVSAAVAHALVRSELLA